VSSIDDLVDERNSLKDEIEILKIKLNRVNEKLSNALANLPEESYTLGTGNKLKVVRGKNRNYDWAGIKASIDPALWERILEPKRALLDELVEEGVVPVSLISQHSVSTDREPFVREF
jgi:hypothetical protein